MKKIILLSVFIFALTSCFWWGNKNNLNDAKNDLLSWSSTNSTNVEKNVDSSVSETWATNEVKSDSSVKISSKYLTVEKFLEIDDFSAEEFSDLKQEITWKVLENVDKIDISYSNIDSGKHEDFSLKKFKSGDKTFMFRAFKEYNTLDYGKNVYQIKASSGDRFSILQYTIVLDNPETSAKATKNEILDISALPTSSVFWNPNELWNGKVTYSDIKGLELEKVGKIDLKNDETSVTDFLKTKYKNIFYWNTKRILANHEDALSFFVVRVEWKKYFYEKHYYTWKYYATLSLEEGDFTAEWNISEKAEALSELNKTLREKNNTYTMIKIADILFQTPSLY